MCKTEHPKLTVFLFDLTGVMSKPWREAGYNALIVDLQHDEGLVSAGDGLWKLRADLRSGYEAVVAAVEQIPNSGIAFVFAFPPCDHLAVSGARWFKGKGLRKLSLAVDLFATAAEFCEMSGAPYGIENPVSTISTYWRKPDYTFHPWHYSALKADDNYTKNTCLWAGGGFVMPPVEPDFSLGAPDNRIHTCPPSEERANIRSATPEGFARAVFKANNPSIEHLF